MKNTVKEYIKSLELHLLNLKEKVKNGSIKEEDLIHVAGSICYKDTGWTPFTTVIKEDDSIYEV